MLIQPNAIVSNRAVQILDPVEGRIRGYVFIWGDSENRDSFSTWFDKSAPPELSLDFAPWPLHYEHAQDGAIQQEIVGKIDRVEFDAIGCRFEASLYRDAPFFGRIIGELKQSKLKTSSATTPHLADFDDVGRFVHWELSEVSLTATPSEHRIPAVEIIRSAEQERNVPGAHGPLKPTIDNTRNMENNMDPEQEVIATDALPTEANLNDIIQAAFDAGFTADDIAAALQSMMPTADAPAELSRVDGEEDDEEEPVTARSLMAALKANRAAKKGASEIETLRAENKALKAARNAAPAPQPRPAHQSNGGQVSVSEPRKFWGRTHSDMMFAYEIMRSKNVRISEDFMRTLSGRAAVAIEKGDPIMNSPHVRSRLQGTRSNEIMTSTATNAGDEWVGIAYSDQLWEQARHLRIFEQLQSRGMMIEEIPQGFESIYVPTEGADPTVYTISQSADDASGRPTVTTTASQVGTDRVLLSPGTLAARVQYTFVFEEDSIVSVAPQMNKQMMEAMQDTVEKLMINGDQTTSGNVNYDGGTPATQYYMASQSGFRKYALVTGSGTSRAGGVLDEDDFMATFGLLPTTVQAQEGDLLWIVDPSTYRKALGLAVAKTRDVNSSMTIETGKLSNVWGIDLFKSGHMPLTDTDGKVTYNAAGTVGSILCVYPKYWAFGWKRHINVEADRDISAQANIIVATMRAGLVPRGAGASTITYNLSV